MKPSGSQPDWLYSRDTNEMDHCNIWNLLSFDVCQTLKLLLLYDVHIFFATDGLDRHLVGVEALLLNTEVDPVTKVDDQPFEEREKERERKRKREKEREWEREREKEREICIEII